MSWFRANQRNPSSSSSYNTLDRDTSEHAFLNHTIRPESPPNYPNSSSTSSSSVALPQFNSHSYSSQSSSSASNFSSSSYNPNATRGPVAEIQDSIQSLNRLNVRLDRMIQKVGTSQDNPDFRDRMQNEQITGSDLCRTTTQALQRLASSNASNSLLPQLAHDFETEMTKFQRYLEDIEHKRQKIIETAHHNISASSTDHAKTRDHDKRQTLLRANNGNFDSSPSSNYGYGNQNNGSGYRNNNSQQQQSFEEQAADVEDLERRNIQIKAVEGQMLEIAEMFKDMQKLVHEQQEVLDIIDNNLVNTHAHVERGHDELVEAEQFQIKARKKKCFIILCLLILGVVIGVVVYFFVK